MKVLVVGGTGLTGAHASIYLHERGHSVTLMSRNKPTIPCLSDFPFIQGNYINDVPVESLAGFDSLVFAAGADIRLLPPEEEENDFFTRVNTVAIPQFFAKCRDAGMKRAVYIGTYYPQVVPEKIDTSAYVKSRHLADEAIRALSTESFRVCSLNAPFILGHVPGLMLPHLQALVHYCAGAMGDLPLCAPGGGVNHISSQSMSEAIFGALEKGIPGKAYLVGDENLSWKDYLEMYCECLGKPTDLDISLDEHPIFPDIIMYAGRNRTIEYEPENGELGYLRGNIKSTIKEVVAAYVDTLPSN